MRALSSKALSAAVLFTLAVSCDRSGNRSVSTSSAVAVSASVSAPVGSASGATPAPPATAAALDAPATGTGVTEVVPLDKAKCAAQSFELATYLQRGELTLAGKGTEVAASWLVQLRDRAQIGFAGFDAESKRIARDRGIGNAREHAPTLFAAGDGFVLAWFDSEGLAYAKPKWEAQPAPEIRHLNAVKDVPPEDLALAAEPSGALVAASPFGTEGDQLSLFLFGIEGKPPEALGLTKGAKKPHRPTIAVNADGYAVAWVENDGGILATRFDRAGKEVAGGHTVVSGVKWVAEDKAARPQIVALGTGWLLLWPDGDRILGRSLGPNLEVGDAPFVVAKGRHLRAISQGGDAIVGYVGEAPGKPDQLLAVRIGASGAKASALQVSDGTTEVMDPPAFAEVGTRMAFAYTEVMSANVKSKRAHLRTFSTACIP